MAVVLVTVVYCYAEFAISSLVVAGTMTSTHCAYSRMSRPGGLVKYPRMVTHPSTNRARHRAAMLIETNTLPLSQAATLSTA